MSRPYFTYESNISDSNSNYDGGKPDLIARVYNGWPANLGDVPYQISFKRVLYRRRMLYASFCGGAIIAPSKLLSAAHCFLDKPNICEQMFGRSGKIRKRQLSRILAVAGQLQNVAPYITIDELGRGQWRHLKGVWYPRKYAFPKWDFAVVMVTSPYNFNDNVNSIPYASKFVNYDGKCLVSGFGRTSPRETSDKLLLAHLTLITWRKCNMMHGSRMDHFICTATQYTDVGKGDSGGPLVCMNTGDPQETSKGVLVGIVSGHAYGVGSFFSRVSTYYKYIERNKSFTSNKTVHRLLLLLNVIHCILLLF